MNVGDYVRTKYGEICKLKKSRFKDLVYETDIEIDRHNDRDCNNYGFDSNTIQDIIKSSPNIIDLIEAGDYVNGYKVEKVEKVKNKELGKKVVLDTKFIIAYDYDTDYIYNKNIKSIVTKEQFESMEYKVKE